MTEEEKPLVHMDHRIYRDEPKVVLDGTDELNLIPRKVKLSIHRMRGLDDDVIREFRRPPSKWVNHWLKLDLVEELVPILFDEDGHPYVMVPPKLEPRRKVRVMIRDDNAYEILEELETAEDFCDYCGVPLSKSCHTWLEHDAESIADVYVCRSCEAESIRWDKSFLEWHPILMGLNLKIR